MFSQGNTSAMTTSDTLSVSRSYKGLENANHALSDKVALVRQNQGTLSAVKIDASNVSVEAILQSLINHTL